MGEQRAGGLGMSLVCRVLWSTWLLVLACGSAAGAASVRVEIDLRAQDVQVVDGPGGATIHLPHGVLGGSPGEPAVPSIGRSVALPDAGRVTGVRVVALETESRAVPRLVAVAPPALPGSHAPAPEPAAWDAGLYPAEVAAYAGASQAAGRTMALLRIAPVQFDPATQRLLIHTHIEVEILYRPTEQPRATALAAPLSLRVSETPAGQALEVDPARPSYVIFATAALAPALRPLAEWKTRRGVPTVILLVEGLAESHYGRDVAERMRNCLRDTYAQHGTTYALIVGPSERTGFRHAFAMDCEVVSPTANRIPTDLYFGDLDGSWDADGDSIFGEVEDEIDLWPEVHVGRLIAFNTAEVTAWADKVLAYERCPQPDQQRRVLMLGEISFSQPYTDDGIGLDRLDELWFGPEYDPIQKLYQSLGNQSRESVLDALNQGPHFVLHCGHAHYTGLSVGQGSVTSTDAVYLHNGDDTFLIYSIGCLAGAYDRGRSVLGEFVRARKGGAFAAIGNTRYGWAAPGNPGFGYSEVLMQGFFRQVLSEGVTRIGPALSAAKAELIPFSRDRNVYRWHQYSVNLFGDPEQTLYTGLPAALNVSAPAQLPAGEIVFEALVSDERGPVAGAQVCLSARLPSVLPALDDGPFGAGTESGTIYWVGMSNDEGRVRFALRCDEPVEARLTATAAGHFAGEQVVEIVADAAPLLAITRVVIDDDDEGASRGNGDGEINAGETVELRLEVGNLGGADAAHVLVMLAGGDQLRRAAAGYTATVGFVPAGGRAAAAEALVLEVPEDAAPRSGGLLELELEAEGGGRWQDRIAYVVRAAEPYVAAARLIELGGDGDRVVEAGETGLVEIQIGNRGNGTLPPVQALLASADGLLDALEPRGRLPQPLSAGAVARLDGLLRFTMKAGAGPVPQAVALEVRLSDGDRAWAAPFACMVGAPGFVADGESIEPVWARVDSPWHRSDRRVFAGEASWYCGDAETGSYDHQLDAVLESPIFIAPANAELRFWRAFSVATYGADGLFIEWAGAEAEDEWQVIDHFGSGGALPLYGIESDWAKVIYPLDIAPGTPCRVRFRFVSDEKDGGEGFYLDDVRVVDGEPGEWIDPSAGTVWPNPFTESTTLRFDLPERSPVRLWVADAEGRSVRALIDRDLAAGSYRLIWDGRNDAGRRAPAGVYFLHLDQRAAGRSWRLLHLR